MKNFAPTRLEYIAFIEGELDENETADIIRWLAEHPKDFAAYQRMRDLHERIRSRSARSTPKPVESTARTRHSHGRARAQQKQRFRWRIHTRPSGLYRQLRLRASIREEIEDAPLAETALEVHKKCDLVLNADDGLTAQLIPLGIKGPTLRGQVAAEGGIVFRNIKPGRYWLEIHSVS